jgi:dTDP-4-amino-4,6-dideoxygalactose transaminase
VGLNSRLDNLQAAFLNFQFENYQSIIDRRRKIATIYQDRLEHIEEIVLPPSPNSDSDHYDVYQNYEIEAENRDELKKFLSNRGVGTIIQWGGKAVHHFTQLGFKCSLPYTDLLFKKLLLIPLNLSLTDNDVHYVCDCIIDFYRQ